MQRGQTQYTKAIDVQLDLLRYYSSQQAYNFFAIGNTLGYQSTSPNEFAQQGRVIRQFTQSVLAIATPIYVAPYICHMLEDAMASFPGDIRVSPQDFPAKNGFVYLDTEWEVGLTASGKSVDYMNSFAWSVQGPQVHILMFGPNRVPGHPTKYDNINQMNDYNQWTFGEPYDYAPDLEKLAEHGGEFVEWLHINQHGQLVTDKIDVAEGAIRKYMGETTMRRYVYAVLSFMQQKIVATGRQNMPRATRRGLPKNYQGDPVIDVITLRGYEQTAHPYEQAESQGGREWASRWIVRGHWRNQHYATLGPASDPAAHRPIWIDAYVKGPDGLPVKNATKLFAVTR